MDVYPKQEETAGLVFPEKAREKEKVGCRCCKRWPAQQSACAFSAGEYYT